MFDSDFRNKRPKPLCNLNPNLEWDTVANCESHQHFQCSHVIFDLDNTLLYTDHLYENIINNVLKELDCSYRLDAKANLERRGLYGFDLAEYLIDKYKMPIVKEDIRNEIIQYYRHYLSKCTMCPGADKLVNYFSRNGIPMAIATTTSDLAFRHMVVNHMELIKKFEHILLSNSDRMPRRGTPHPQMYIVCAARFFQRPSSCSCVVFDDSIYGIRAATKIGMKTVFIASDPNTPYSWRNEANQTIDKLDDFNPDMFGFPPLYK
ncbi:pseudouridine-5'-phosphatase-like [Chrysoperla carnea]|uniref:pseudouridine-5'-phosphatase-like n=1 Tax=Chrysoperla carnea TaxID=189513 RepID=UPI001D063001|nr:pseudouridine-5'-phosphatase-like [Chrysoperla carnea]